MSRCTDGGRHRPAAGARLDVERVADRPGLILGKIPCVPHDNPAFFVHADDLSGVFDKVGTDEREMVAGEHSDGLGDHRAPDTEVVVETGGDEEAEAARVVEGDDAAGVGVGEGADAGEFVEGPEADGVVVGGCGAHGLAEGKNKERKKKRREQTWRVRRWR